MEQLLQSITLEDIQRISLGTKLDPKSIRDKNVVRDVAVHCVINGPVGIAKKTKFLNLDEEISIKSCFTSRITSRQWKTFCLEVANRVKSVKSDWKKCQSVEIFGDLWPLSEDRVSK